MRLIAYHLLKGSSLLDKVNILMGDHLALSLVIPISETFSVTLICHAKGLFLYIYRREAEGNSDYKKIGQKLK